MRHTAWLPPWRDCLPSAHNAPLAGAWRCDRLFGFSALAVAIGCVATLFFNPWPWALFIGFAYGAACSEVAIDTLTGESRVIAVDILHDIGRSINPGIDIGQVEGGFIQGMGWLTCEEVVWNAKGRLLSHAPSTYKIPASGDVPKHFKVEFWPEPNREENVFGSKATGETPLMLAISVFEAIRHAIGCVAGPGVVHIPLQAPATPETILKVLTAVRPS